MIYIHRIRQNTYKRYRSNIYEGKKGNYMIANNIQSAVDYNTKLICTINVTQNPTDHYELQNIAERE